MKKITIGTNGESFDLDLLLQTRCLIQANSGGGKSWALRKMVEETYGKVPIIMIDPEGEFASLREQYDFLLVGKDGEIPADVRSASMLAEKLLELNASAICDIYEMRVGDKHLWVKNFLEALINAPKKLWHPVIIVIDEAHLFAPEKGQGESIAYESVIDLASRGRKRGFCLVAATQRLGKLSKNVSAELQNVMIGSTFQDIDRKRAAETLGIPKSEERQFSTDMKVLEPGMFYALGRAISKERIILAVGPVSTTHPQSGKKYKMAPPPASAKVTAMLSELKDLPAQAEEKAKNEAELRKEIAELKRQLKAVPVAKSEIKEVNVMDEKQVRRLETTYKSINGELEKHRTSLDILQKNIIEVNEFVLKALGSVQRSAPVLKEVNRNVPESYFHKGVADTREKYLLAPAKTDFKPGKAEMAILSVLAQYPQGKSKTQVAILAGYSHGGGSFNNAIYSLRSKGFLTGDSGNMQITREAVTLFGPFKSLPTGVELFLHWMDQLGKAEKEILDVLWKNYPQEMTKEEIAGKTASNYAPDGGSYNNAIYRLRSLELINGRGKMKASKDLF